MTTLFRGAFRTVSIISIVSLAGMVGCGLFKKKGDEADAGEDAAVAEAVDAAPAPVAAPIAANVDDVARFPDEKPIENVAGTIQRNFTNVREIPAVGKVVATLAKGGTVTQVASRGTAILVVFENPKDQKKLMGWVGQEAFTAPPAVEAGVKVLTCSAPEVPLLSDGPFCGRICTGDPDCPAGQACKGAANKFTNARLGDAVTVCTVFTPGAARPGVAVATDAGRAVTPPPPPPPVVAVPNVDVTPAVAGACPAGFLLLTKDGQCHKRCTVGGCRIATRFCVPCQGATVCTSTLNFCK
jgi:hypothetical protein